MSDEEVRVAVLDQLTGLTGGERVKRGLELIELLNRSLLTEVANDRAETTLSMREAGKTIEAIANETGSSPQAVTKMMERAHWVRNQAKEPARL